MKQILWIILNDNDNISWIKESSYLTRIYSPINYNIFNHNVSVFFNYRFINIVVRLRYLTKSFLNIHIHSNTIVKALFNSNIKWIIGITILVVVFFSNNPKILKFELSHMFMTHKIEHTWLWKKIKRTNHLLKI